MSGDRTHHEQLIDFLDDAGIDYDEYQSEGDPHLTVVVSEEYVLNDFAFVFDKLSGSFKWLEEAGI